jgi:hypothetical protein
MKNKIQDMKKDMNRLSVPVRTMHLSEDGEMSYTMDMRINVREETEGQH